MLRKLPLSSRIRKHEDVDTRTAMQSEAPRLVGWVWQLGSYPFGQSPKQAPLPRTKNFSFLNSLLHLPVFAKETVSLEDVSIQHFPQATCSRGTLACLQKWANHRSPQDGSSDDIRSSQHLSQSHQIGATDPARSPSASKRPARQAKRRHSHPLAFQDRQPPLRRPRRRTRLPCARRQQSYCPSETAR
jgi:hypothetical protein